MADGLHVRLSPSKSGVSSAKAYQTLVNAGANIIGSGDHGVMHSRDIEDPDGNQIELYIDVQPELWRDDPQAVLTPVKSLQL